ncbi:MAG: hypothetical protein CEO12_380 [Parcubacteria group bacterium Gr01-1014_46]|nr:MAG: hypothetical protein CEO12_380 [Parcubacteria group bacterium Gr01-1014_46]
MNEDNQINKQIELQKNIKDEVLKKISSGEVGMRSKAYFLIKLVVLAVVVMLVTFISVFLLSFTIFSMSLDGSLFLVRFGGTGLYHFIFILPWYLLAVDVLLLVLLDWILKSFRFGYKSPIVYLFIGTFFITTIISTLINLTPFHQNLMKQIQTNKFPLIPNIYSGVRSEVQKPGTWKGFVGSINGNRFEFSFTRDFNQEMETVVVIALPDVLVDQYLDVGDLVFVAGSLVDGEIKAYGIKKLNE